MKNSSPDLFTLIMEADDDIPDFSMDDTGTPDASAEGAGDVPQDAAPAEDQSGSEDLPPAENEETNNFDFDINAAGEEGNETAEDGSDESTADQDNPEGEKIGEKANNALNQKLYTVMTERNAEIDSHLKQIQQVLSVLPYETAEELDKPINQLKRALSKGQSYAIDKFVGSEYGTNLTFYEKLNALYTLLEDDIDKIIKKTMKDNS